MMKNRDNSSKDSYKGKLRKMLSGFLAVSTAVTMLGGDPAFFAGKTAYALADEGSGEDVTIHFGDDDINIHVNPAAEDETIASVGFGAETDAEADTATDAEADTVTDVETESETEAESGVKEVTDGALVTISAVDESDLPEDAEANAKILTGRKEAKAVDKVEEAEAETEMTAHTEAAPADLEPVTPTEAVPATVESAAPVADAEMNTHAEAPMADAETATQADA